MFIINFYLNMFQASLCPSSGEQRPCYCIWCIVLFLLDVVGSGCGVLRCKMRAPLVSAAVCTAMLKTVPKYSTLKTPKSTDAHYLKVVLRVMSGSSNPFISSNKTKNLMPYCMSSFSVLIIKVILQSKISLSKTSPVLYRLIFSASWNPV